MNCNILVVEAYLDAQIVDNEVPVGIDFTLSKDLPLQ